MARQQRLTGARTAWQRPLGEVAPKASGAGPHGHAPSQGGATGEHPGPTTRGVPEASGAPSGEADEAARRMDTDAERRRSSERREDAAPVRGDPTHKPLRLKAAGVGAHRQGHPLGDGTGEALPGRQAPSRRGQVGRSSAASHPGRGRQPADASHAEGWVSGTGPTARSLRRTRAVGEGRCGAPRIPPERAEGAGRFRSADSELRLEGRRRWLRSCTSGDGWRAARGLQRCRASRGNPGGDIAARYGHSFGSGPAPPTPATGAREGGVSGTSGHRRARGSGTSVRRSRRGTRHATSSEAGSRRQTGQRREARLERGQGETHPSGGGETAAERRRMPR
jgi:hypothetical protein